ncbi:MAG: dTMP kinase [Candidatus Omnitrophica bacterium]|nr:dTMP kinase [Candidatus Omnitrophota bacterium]MDD5237103.1 dTMP kinase [Candidatus Omnitrophota bacterium]
MKGKFITFEGSEGSGKSTQSKLLCAYLKKKGYKTLFIREPGATKVGEKIRGILLDTKNKSLLPVCETLLYMAARSQLVEEVIVPALKKGTIVVADRFLDSTLAYQGYGLGIDINAIRSIGRFATRGIAPDLTIFLDQDVASGLKHRCLTRDRIEERSFCYHLRVRRGYLKLAKAEPKRIKIVKVHDHKLKTQEKIRKLIENVI